MKPNEALSRFTTLLHNPPDLDSLRGGSPDCEDWVAKADALLSVVTQQLTYDTSALAEFRIELERVRHSTVDSWRQTSKNRVFHLLKRNMERVKLAVDPSHDGSFIPVGSDFDAYTEIARIAATANTDLIIVDPYMDDKILTEFLASVEGKTINLLSDESTVRGELNVAAQKWRSQYGKLRPIEVRLTPARTLHDRLIIVDQRIAWSVTQSFKDLAKRSPGSILKADSENAKLKIEAYMKIWKAAKVVP